MSNPLVSQGTLNRLIASVTWTGFPALNVTPSFLNRDGIRLALDGESTKFLPSLAGAVTSPEPYQMCTLSLNLLKSQGLAALYKAQMETQCLLGNCVVRPDAATLPTYALVNMAIEGVRELAFSGEDAGFSITCRGYYLVNNSLWL
jgi:hypothetical protein